jgi:hypothetical protein
VADGLLMSGDYCSRLPGRGKGFVDGGGYRSV